MSSANSIFRDCSAVGVAPAFSDRMSDDGCVQLRIYGPPTRDVTVSSTILSYVLKISPKTSLKVSTIDALQNAVDDIAVILFQPQVAEYNNFICYKKCA